MITLLFLILLCSCSMSEIMQLPCNDEEKTIYKARERTDTTEENNGRIPISFEVNVEQWKEQDK